MLRRLLLVAALLGLAVGDASGQTHGLRFGPEPRLELLPILLIPSDNTSITPEEIEQISKLAYAHLEVAQGHYKELLKTDSFKIADGDLIVFQSSHPHAHYLPTSRSNVDAWRLAVREVMEWRGEDRFGAKYIYVIIYARPPNAARPYEGIPGMGYGRAFNGSPGSGGGAIVIELSAHLYETYPHVPGGRGQALLMHELGHAFGLRHVDCYGYNQSTDNGFMSYNWNANETKGPNPSRGIMNPEDYFVLSRNKLAFPNFNYDEQTHNPRRKPLDRIESCYFYPYGEFLGPISSLPQQPGVGLEIFFNEQRVTSKSHEFFAFKRAKEACRNMTGARGQYAGSECRYNGERFDPGPEPKRPDLAGAWAARCDEPRQTFLEVDQDANGALTLSRPGAPEADGQLLTNDFEVYTMITTDVGQAFISADGKRLEWNNRDGVWWHCAEGAMEPSEPFTAMVSIRHSGKCMDARRGAMDDDEVWQWECGGTDGRRWQFIQDADGYYTIEAQHSGRCLSIYEADMTQSGMAFQTECNSADSQKFKLIPDNDGFYRLVAKHSNLCLRVLRDELFDGQIIHQAACGDHQYNFRLQM